MPGELSFAVLSDIYTILHENFPNFEFIATTRHKAVPLLYLQVPTATYDDLLSIKEILEAFGKTIVQKTIKGIEKLMWYSLYEVVNLYYYHETNIELAKKPIYESFQKPEFKLPSEEQLTAQDKEKVEELKEKFEEAAKDKRVRGSNITEEEDKEEAAKKANAIKQTPNNKNPGPSQQCFKLLDGEFEEEEAEIRKKTATPPKNPKVLEDEALS